jgi:hypothetical protein
LALSELVNASQLARNEDGQPPAWIDPPATDREPRPPFGYVVSFIRFHERGFAVPTSRYMRGMCYHYGVELHNFASNAISLVATFVGGATQAHHAGAEGAQRGAHRRCVDLVAGNAQGALHPLHDDLQQR